MIRWTLSILVAGLVVTLAGLPVLGPAAAVAADEKKDEVIEVEVVGEGVSKEEATKDALRKALEKAGQQEIFSDTKVRNFELIHDTIISRAKGIVTDYKVLEEKPVVGGTWKVKIKARVSKKVLAESWGEVQNILNQIGRPKIMIWINERIDGKLEEQSLLETKLEERLLKSGFDLVSRRAIEAIKQKELADAAAEDDVKKLQAIAKSFDAHIFITGTANANQAGLEVIHNVPIAFYNCDVQLKAYYTDTGKLLASKGIPNTRGGARGRKEFSPQAGKMALGFAGENVVEEIYAQLMEQWTTAITGGGELILDVEGIKVPAAIKIKKALAELDKVENVNYDYTKGHAKYRINAKLSGEALTELLIEPPFDELMEIVDMKLNRVQAKGLDN